MTTSLLSKVIASANAFTGLTAVANGVVQKVTGDSLGRLWARVFGDVPHDSPDNTNSTANYPVKIGARATSDPLGFTAVAADDRTDAAADLQGKLLVNPQGNVAADAVDAGNPVKTGGVAADPTTGLAAVSGTGDRVNLALDVSGRAIALAQGNVAHDAADAGFPLKGGGYAYSQAPAQVSADGDRVNHWFDRVGRADVTMDQTIAGENPVLDVLRIIRGKLPVEQESWLNGVITGVASLVIKSSAGRLARIQLLNTSATGVYVILHDSTTATSISTIRWRGWLPAASGGVPGVLDIDFTGADGLYFETGISYVASTAVASYGATGLTTDLNGNYLYI